MKILVLHNDSFKESDHKAFTAAIDNLRRLGHNVKSDLEMKSSVKKGDLKSVEKYQKKLEKAVRDTDIVISDVTNADAKLGFDIANSLSEKKIVIALHNGKGDSTDILPIDGTDSRILIVRKYTEKDINEIVTDAIEEAKSKLDTKFILIISPEIDRYLDWASNTKRMHKAQIVRNSIEAAMKKDREFKNYLNG